MLHTAMNLTPTAPIARVRMLVAETWSCCTVAELWTVRSWLCRLRKRFTSSLSLCPVRASYSSNPCCPSSFGFSLAHTHFFSLKLDLRLFSPHCFLVIKVIGLGTESLQIPQSSLIHSDHLRLQLPMGLSAENIRWKIPEAA